MVYPDQGLGQTFLTGYDFEPPGDIWQCLETYLVVTTGGGEGYWHLVGIGQEYC